MLLTDTRFRRRSILFWRDSAVSISRLLLLLLSLSHTVAVRLLKGKQLKTSRSPEDYRTSFWSGEIYSGEAFAEAFFLRVDACLE
jgi:hypothetical protein